jgi:hypothetical protein
LHRHLIILTGLGSYSAVPFIDDRSWLDAHQRN